MYSTDHHPLRPSLPVLRYLLRRRGCAPTVYTSLFINIHTTQVIILASIQVYMFGVLVAFYPLVWIMPGIKLVGRLDKVGWMYHQGPNHAYNLVAFINYMAVKPGQWLYGAIANGITSS